MADVAKVTVRRKLSDLEHRAQAGARLLDQFERVSSNTATRSFRFNVNENKIPFFDDDPADQILSELNNVCDFFKMAGIETTISEWGLSGFTLKCLPGKDKSAAENFQDADMLLTKREKRFTGGMIRGITLEK